MSLPQTQTQNFSLTPTSIQNNGQINQQTSPIQVELPKEQVYRIYQTLEKMKKEGKDLSDPKYKYLAQVLKTQLLIMKQKQQQNQQITLNQQIQLQQPVFTREQILQLKAQIFAYRNHILRKIPMPPQLFNAVKGINVERNLQEYEILCRSQQIANMQQQLVSDKSTQGVYQQSGQIQRPQGLDLNSLIIEREKRIQYKIKVRFNELKRILQTSQNPKEQIKTVIEMKGIQLLQLQKKVREDVLKEAVDIQNSLKKKAKTIGKRKRPDMDFSRRDKNRRFLNEIINYRKKFKDFFKERKKTIDKINKELLSYFERKRRLEKERRERAERARLKALKENDSEAYFRLLEETKDQRLMELLRQTDACLQQLGAQLVAERDGEEGKDKKEEEKEENENKKGSVYSQYLRNERAYYTVAHKFTEKIERQPRGLVGGQLKEYQLQGLQWLVSLYNNKLNGILADEMGLGKTIQTISLLTYLMETKGNKGPHLVIVPLSTLENWYQEFQKWAPCLSVVKYTGNQQRRKEVQHTYLKDRKFNVLLTQYEFVSRDRRVLKKIPWNYIIIDEGHRIKNANCKLVQDLGHYKSQHRLLLTGTPLQNDLKELWALLHFLLPKIFDNSVNFEQWFNSPFQNLGSNEKVTMTEEETLLIIHRLHQVLRPFLLRREKADVEDQLPEKVEKVIRCALSAMQKKFYEQIQNNGRLLLDKQGKIKSKSLNNTVMQLRKVCNHPFLFLDDWSSFSHRDLIRASGKFELLDRMLPKLKASGHRVLLFSQMTQLLNILQVYLDYRGFKYMRLDGNVKADVRGHLVKDFNASDSPYFIFLLSTRSGGLGLNLQSADTVIIFDSDWNPQQDLQAQARAHRIGQTKEVRVFVLITASPVEEKIRERALLKRDAEAKVIQAGMFNQKSTHKERQEMLETILIKTEDLFSVEDIPDDDQLNHLMARTPEELALFTEMDRKREEEEEKYWASLGLPRPERLMTEEELPDWLQQPEAQLEKLAEENQYGRGLRNRNKKINYTDADKTDTSVPDSEMSDETSDTSSIRDDRSERSFDSDDDETPKRKSRSKKKPSEKKRKQSPVEFSEPPKKKRSTKKKPRVLETELQKQLHEIYTKIVQLKDGDRDVAALFIDLPPKNIYPDYYQLIKNPICLKQIEDKIYENPNYNLEAMENDISLMAKNAQTYNEEGSMVYNDSIAIMNTFLAEKQRILQSKPQTPEQQTENQNKQNNVNVPDFESVGQSSTLPENFSLFDENSTFTSMGW